MNHVYFESLATKIADEQPLTNKEACDVAWVLHFLSVQTNERRFELVKIAFADFLHDAPKKPPEQIAALVVSYADAVLAEMERATP